MLIRFLILAIFVSFVLLFLASCASTPPVDLTAKEVARAEQTALSIKAEVSPDLLNDLDGPVAISRRADFPARQAAKLWNRDRERLEICVATHEALRQQLVVTGGIPKPVARPVSESPKDESGNS